jgi:hypothetical protein
MIYKIFIKSFPKSGLFYVEQTDTMVNVAFEDYMNGMMGEYYTIVEALDFCLKNGIEQVIVCSRQNCVVSTLCGKSSIRDEKTVEIYKVIFRMAKLFKKLTIKLVPEREFPKPCRKHSLKKLKRS